MNRHILAVNNTMDDRLNQPDHTRSLQTAYGFFNGKFNSLPLAQVLQFRTDDGRVVHKHFMSFFGFDVPVPPGSVKPSNGASRALSHFPASFQERVLRILAYGRVHVNSLNQLPEGVPSNESPRLFYKNFTGNISLGIFPILN
jgi:hypothetical protein